MRIVFMGASHLGWQCCHALFEMGQDVVGIFSMPGQFQVSRTTGPVTNVQFKSFDEIAAAHAVPLITVSGKLSEPSYIEALRALRPDLLVVIGWYSMLPKAFRQAATLGAVGIHASLLPRYRGWSPLVWAVINGETLTGLTLFHFDDGVDAGDIVGQVTFGIALDDDIADVVEKASSGALELVRQYVPMLAAGVAPRRPQNHGDATLVAHRGPADGVIDWKRQTAMQVYNWVRAQTRPYPGAFTHVGGKKMTIWRATVPTGPFVEGLQPGTISIAAGSAESVRIVCADGRPVQIEEAQLDGAAPVDGRALAVTTAIAEAVCHMRPADAQ